MITPTLILTMVLLALSIVVIAFLIGLRKTMKLIWQLLDDNLENERNKTDSAVENNNPGPPAPEKVNQAQLINAIENASGSNSKNIYLKKLFSDDTQLADSFQQLFVMASRQISQAIEAKQFSSALSVLDNTRKIVESYAWRLFSTEIENVINTLNELVDSTHKVINDSLQKMLSHHDLSAITIQLIDSITIRDLSPEIAKKLWARRTELELNAKMAEAQDIADTIQREINQVDPASEEAVTTFQHIGMKLQHITKLDEILLEKLAPLRQQIENKRDVAVRYQRLAELFADQKKIGNAIEILGKYDKPILASGPELLKAEEAASTMTVVASEYEQLMQKDTDMNVPVKIDPTRLSIQIQNVEVSKINSYQTWALNIMESALVKFEDAVFLWQSDEVKAGLVTDILSSTLWLIEVNALSGPVSSLYRSIEDRILKKLKEEIKLHAVKRSLTVQRVGYQEIEV